MQNQPHRRRFNKRNTPPPSKYVAGDIKYYRPLESVFSVSYYARILEVPNPHKILMNTFFGNTTIQNFSVHFNPASDQVAVGTEDGEVRVYDIYTSKNLVATKTWKAHMESTTCVRWKPSSTHHSFITSCADGSLTWFKGNGEVIHRETTENKHAMLCCEFSTDSSFVITGYDNGDVVLVDDETHKTIHTYEANTTESLNRNHTSRVFCARALAGEDPHLFITGGWDSRVLVWDSRLPEPIRCIHGPNISGESLDYKSGQILTGSYRNDDILQLWDLKSGQLKETIKTDLAPHEAAYCYTAAFSRTGSLIAMGTSGNNQVHLYDRNYQNRIVGKLQMQGPCFSVDFGSKNNLFTCSGAEGVVYVFTVSGKN